MLNHLLKKIIKTANGSGRLVLAVIGLAIAMLLILAAVQLQANYNSLLYSKTNQDSVANFLVVNKPINDANVNASTLSDSEINNLKQQPFIDEIGILTPSRFKVQFEVASSHFPMTSDVFFESVPQKFLDVNVKEWQWNEQRDFVPVIIPSSFLDMYNFGFAASQGMPQITPEILKAIPCNINVLTPLGTKTYAARLVGFSNRITSIIVPQEFNDFANKNYGTSSAKPARVVIRTKDPGDPKLTEYLKKNNLTTDEDKTRFSKYRRIVAIVVNISWATGAAMLMFALLVFTLFIQLTIASARQEITLLITLGTSPKQLQSFLMRRFFPVNIIITLAVLGVLSVAQYFLKNYLQTQNIYIMPYISWVTGGAAVLILVVLWLVNYSTIKKYIKV